MGPTTRFTLTVEALAYLDARLDAKPTDDEVTAHAEAYGLAPVVDTDGAPVARGGVWLVRGTVGGAPFAVTLELLPGEGGARWLMVSPWGGDAGGLLGDFERDHPAVTGLRWRPLDATGAEVDRSALRDPPSGPACDACGEGPPVDPADPVALCAPCQRAAEGSAA